MRLLKLKNLPTVLSVLGQGVGALLLALTAFLFLNQTFQLALQTQTHGFAAYYTGAWMLHHGRAVSLYDAVAFNAAMQESGIQGIYDIYDANAPLLAALSWPLGLWSPMTARAVWLWFNLGLLLVTLFPASRLHGRRGLLTFCLTGAFLFSYTPLRENFRLGQMYLPFLTAAFLALTLSSAASRGVALALQVALKLYYGFFGTVAGLAHLKSLLWAVALILGAGLLLLPWLGPALWFDYARLATGFSGRPETAVTAYQTVNSFFAHLFRYDARWNPQPVANLPFLAQLLTLVVDGFLLISSAILIWKAYRAGIKPNSKLARLTTALALSLAPLLAPIAEEYHFTILALPLLVAVGVQGPESSVQSRMLTKLEKGEAGKKPISSRLWTVDAGLWILSWFLLAWPLGYKEWQALIAYPRFYGALLLWLLLVRLIRVELLTSQPLTLGEDVNHG